MTSRRALAVAFVSALLSSATAFAAAPDDPLWKNAVAVASTNRDWVAGLTVMRSEVLLKGEAVKVQETWQRSTLGEKGEVVTKTIKVLEDGKDVTAQQKPEPKEKRETTKKKPNKGGGNPFDSGVQEDLTAKRTDRTKVIAGAACVGYEFDLRSKDGQRVKGIAWLEKENGCPLEIEDMTVDPLPEKHLKRMAITMRYESTPEAGWHVKEMITTATLSVMFIKADTRTVATFSEYWKKPPAIRRKKVE